LTADTISVLVTSTMLVLMFWIIMYFNWDCFTC